MMGLFDKKYCDVCGEKIGLLGNRKLENGNLCKACAKNLSPWFDERRHSTVEKIKEQLAYREANRQEVKNFKSSLEIGDKYLVCIDENAGKFYVSQSKDIHSENPDVLDISQVKGCDLNIKDHRMEQKRTGSDGKSTSYSPPRYRTTYAFYLTIRVNHPYFDEMKFEVNEDVVSMDSEGSAIGGLFGSSTTRNSNLPANYHRYEKMCQEIIAALMANRTASAGDNTQNASGAPSVSDAPSTADAPKVAVTCPYCSATTTPDASGNCKFCGGAIN